MRNYFPNSNPAKIIFQSLQAEPRITLRPLPYRSVRVLNINISDQFIHLLPDGITRPPMLFHLRALSPPLRSALIQPVGKLDPFSLAGRPFGVDVVEFGVGFPGFGGFVVPAYFPG